MNTREIAEACGITTRAVQKRAKRLGWKKVGRVRVGGTVYDDATISEGARNKPPRQTGTIVRLLARVLRPIIIEALREEKP